MADEVHDHRTVDVTNGAVLAQRRRAERSQSGKVSIPAGGYRRMRGNLRSSDSVASLGAQVRRRATSRADLTAMEHGAVAVHTAPKVLGGPGQPQGFGQMVEWTGEEDLAIIAFVNASDDLGVAVSGVRDGDTVEIVQLAGHATFEKSTKNKGIPGLISVVGVGLGIGAAAFGLPEVAPLITAAAAYAAKEFAEAPESSKRRNAWGEADNGDKSRQEGGIIICEPAARALFSSANDESKGRWIQPDGDRDTSETLPKHIPPGTAFFPTPRTATRTLHGDGDLVLAPWDYSFLDNSGHYRVHLVLRRKSDDGPIVE